LTPAADLFESEAEPEEEAEEGVVEDG